jgi:hypothetical protein
LILRNNFFIISRTSYRLNISKWRTGGEGGNGHRFYCRNSTVWKDLRRPCLWSEGCAVPLTIDRIEIDALSAASSLFHCHVLKIIIKKWIDAAKSDPSVLKNCKSTRRVE